MLTAAGVLMSPSAYAQQAGVIAGRVVLEASGEPLQGVTVTVLTLGRAATTGDDGRFQIRGVPAGRHEVVAQREHLAADRQAVTVAAGETAELSFSVRLSPVHEELTVIGGRLGAAATFDAFSSITSLDTLEIAKRSSLSLAGVLESEPGIQTRSFGPGSVRPIIRGFDGDRVLIMQDGIRSGDLSSQSGDHGTTLDPGGLERLEVIKGPATLLYGSNAVGGVVNAVTPVEMIRESPFTGVRGQVLTSAGSTNGQATGSANLQWGSASGWNVWVGGGSRRTGDYMTPEGRIENSDARFSNARLGLGYVSERRFFSLAYDLEQGRYGVPFGGRFHSHGDEEEAHGHEHGEAGDDHDDHDHDHGDEEEHAVDIDIEPRRHSVRLDLGVRQLTNPFLAAARITASLTDWRHDEVETEQAVESLGTRFDNRQTLVRADFDQQRSGRLSGRFGASVLFRDYDASGEEALAAETSQQTTALFAYEELALGPARLMAGGRFERTSYDTIEREGRTFPPTTGGHAHGQGGLLPPGTRDRDYSGFSGSTGAHVDLGSQLALVATLSRSFRAPALEELYNFGPHVGNLTFELGNTNLNGETTVGIDVSLRHRSTRARGEVNAYRYAIDNFVFPRYSAGEMIDGLRVADYRQNAARFTGVDGRIDLQLHEHLWVNAGAGFVRAELTALGQDVPRIPPAHARVGLSVPIGHFSIEPEMVVAARQDRVSVAETPTDGYTVFNIGASYTITRGRSAHIVSLESFNVGDKLYRNHTSFIKDLAPELGRGVRVSYAVKFF